MRSKFGYRKGSDFMQKLRISNLVFVCRMVALAVENQDNETSKIVETHLMTTRDV